MKKFKTIIAIIFTSLLLIFTACNKSASFTPAPEPAPAPAPEPNIDKLDGNCVQVFYDSSKDPSFQSGRTHALMLLNLLGHFPEYQQVIGPIEKYKKDDLNRCHASFYMGGVFGNTLPRDFLNDFRTTTRQVVWIGYNFWQLGVEFEKMFGYRDYIFTTLDYNNRSTDGKPGFFRDVLYKGETFSKYSAWSPALSSSTASSKPNPSDPPPGPPTHSLVTSFEIAKLTTKTSDASEVMATTKHSATNEVVPWALKAGNKFFVVETPFTFIHEGDRYFVFTDLLFDFLKAEPKHNSKNALLRLEDIHPFVELKYLDEAVSMVKRHAVTPHIMIVPIYKDPLFYLQRPGDNRVEVRMEEVPLFASLIRRVKAEGSVFIWHGITHQYHDIKNPFTGASGDDYEFWDFTKNSPIAEDSVSFVLDRFENGFKSLKQFSIAPKVWVTPHYHGSALDSAMFGKMFNWVIGRGVYLDSKISGMKALDSTKPIHFDLTNTATAQNRQDFFSDLKVEVAPEARTFGQLYPYEIYGNIYGENMIPENLGNVQPFLNNQVVATRNVDQILADAKRNLVLRDVWASVFYHPFLLDPGLNAENKDTSKPKDLERLVTGIKALGYKFINIDEYAVSTPVKKVKPRIEIE